MQWNSQAKLLRAESSTSPYSNEAYSSTSDVFHPTNSDSDIPLTINTQGDSHYQQWDRHGKAVGYALDPSIIHTPKPLVANTAFLPSTYPRDVEEGGNINTHGRQESTDAVGWHQDSPRDGDPDVSDSFVQIPPTTKNYPNPHEVQQTPTQSNFVNGPLSVNLSPTNVNFNDVYGSTSSFHSALGSPRQEQQTALPNPFSSHDEQQTPQPNNSQLLPHPRSSSPSNYIIDLR
jgi:hypothetical protein